MDAIEGREQVRTLEESYYSSSHFILAGLGIFSFWTAFKIGRPILGIRAGFLAMLFLVLTPRFYGEMFNNPVDIPFAALFLGAV